MTFPTIEQRRTQWAALLIAVLLSACGVETFDEEASNFRQQNPGAGGGGGGGGGGSGGGGTPPGPAGFDPNFSEIQANLFTPTCATSGCHDASAVAGLDLRAGMSYAMLVGIASSQEPGLMRVAPSDPDSSYLVRKLEGTAGSGQQMPPGAALEQPVIDVVRQWITDGAIDDTATPPAAPIRVSSIVPTPNQTLDSAPMQIVAGFTRDLDASTVSALTFVVTGSGGDGNFTNGNETDVMAASVAVPNSNPASAVFDVGGTALPDDNYRVTLRGNGASVILDTDANALDGEFSGILPSGNGAAGGDFLSFFTVSTPVVVGPTLDEIQAAVFTPNCATAGCHTGPAGNMLPSGLDLSDADASFASLVNVMSNQSAGDTLVVPGDAAGSYLVQKIEGTAAVGNRMPPPPRDALDAQEIAAIRQWIDDGALR